MEISLSAFLSLPWQVTSYWGFPSSLLVIPTIVKFILKAGDLPIPFLDSKKVELLLSHVQSWRSSELFEDDTCKQES